ncbi:MAG: hypothetical protein ACHQAY_18205 [Hyphomicrobiales bacterium]
MTTTTMTLERRWRPVSEAALMLAALLIIGGFILHWSWNAFAVDLLGARAMELKHAFAAELLVAVVAATLALVARIFGGAGRGRDAA